MASSVGITRLAGMPQRYRAAGPGPGPVGVAAARTGTRRVGRGRSRLRSPAGLLDCTSERSWRRVTAARGAGSPVVGVPGRGRSDVQVTRRPGVFAPEVALGAGELYVRMVGAPGPGGRGAGSPAPGRGPGHQLGGEQHLLVPVVGFVASSSSSSGGGAARARGAAGAPRSAARPPRRRTRCRRSRRSPGRSGTRQPERDALLQEAEGEQVVGAERGGRAGAGGQPGEPLAGAAALGDGQRRGADDGQQVGRGQAGLGQAAARPPSRSRTWPMRLRAADERDPRVAAVDAGARRRAGRRARRRPRPSSACSPSRVRSTMTTGVPRADDRRPGSRSSGSTGVIRMPCTRCCWSRARGRPRSRSALVVAVADEQRQVGSLGGVLDALRDVGEERVARRRASRRPACWLLPGPQLAGGLVAHEAELGHRLLDPLPGRGADPVGPVQDVGDGAERDAGGGRDVLDRGADGARSAAVRVTPRLPRPGPRSLKRHMAPSARRYRWQPACWPRTVGTDA